MATGQLSRFFATTVNGDIVPSGRTKYLVWTLPIVFLLAAFYLLITAFMWDNSSDETIGTVVEIETIIQGDTEQYLPVVEYIWSDGNLTTAPMSATSEGFNLEIGTQFLVQFDPAEKSSLRLSDWQYQYGFGLIVLMIAFVSLVFATILWLGVKSLAKRKSL
ncbi:MAG: hypothetical protein JKY31_03440 [Rhodobacteraceae bacterium]|nr:hypothetical protein [Paracoccaceae bacterium]